MGKHGPGIATYPLRSPHQCRLFQECNYHGSKPVPVPGRNLAESALSRPTLCQTKLMFFSMLRREDFAKLNMNTWTSHIWYSSIHSEDGGLNTSFALKVWSLQYLPSQGHLDTLIQKALSQTNPLSGHAWPCSLLGLLFPCLSPNPFH